MLRRDPTQRRSLNRLPQFQSFFEARGQVVLRYCDAAGALIPEANPNGSAGNIAGLASEAGNVFALMRHPERASEPLLGGTDGRLLFESVLLQVASVARS